MNEHGTKHAYKLQEIIESFELEHSFVTYCLRHHWITPTSTQEALFDDEDIARILLIRDLKRDFEVNDEAIPIILHLLDQLHHFRNQLKHYARAA